MKTVQKSAAMILSVMIVLLCSCKSKTDTGNQPGVTDSLVQNPNPTVQYDTVKSTRDTAHHPDTSTLHKY